MAVLRLLRQQERKYIIIAVTILSVFIIFLLRNLATYGPPPEREFHESAGRPSLPVLKDHNEPFDCYIDTDLLRSYGYNSSVRYTRWDIAVERSRSFTKFSDRLDLPTPQFEPVEFGPEARKSLGKCSTTARITAPLPAPVDASHITFGVATSQERLYQSLEAFGHWAGGTKARIFALVEPDGPLEAAIEQRARELDIRLTIFKSDLEVLDRYITLTRVFLENRDSASEWGVVMDDDTFFPSMGNLVNRLASYNHTEPQYIGALTETINGLGNYGYMAYGGAGIFLSFPLLEEMESHYDECAKLTEFGDKRISQCIYLHTTTKLTWERGLHQLDFWQSDGSGFYESGRPLPLSVHHWKSNDWFPVDIVGMSKVSAACGDDCQLQRWRISDDWFFINGFSIIQYSAPMMDTVGMEQTWDPSPWAREEGFAYSLGPLRPKDEAKFSLRLRSSFLDEDGSVRQFYVHDQDQGEPPLVMEVVWRVVKAG